MDECSKLINESAGAKALRPLLFRYRIISIPKTSWIILPIKENLQDN